jgi:hypothetical protein
MDIPVDATNWGPSVHGIRLAILAANTSFRAGSDTTLVAVITNSSTNPIQVLRIGMVSAFSVFATNASGKGYRLTDPLPSSRHTGPLNPGDTASCDIPIFFGTNMEPGEYAVRGFTRVWGDNTNYDLESNSLKFRVK